MTEKGVWLYEQRYMSEALKAADVLAKLKRSPQTTLTVRGYMLEMCVRHIWVEIQGELLLLDAQLRLRDDEQLLFLSSAELKQWHEARGVVASAFGPHQHATTAETMRTFEEDVGKRWEAGRIRRGKPKNDKLAQREFTEARKYTSGGTKAA